VQGGKWFVEADVPGLADAEDLQVDSAKPFNGGFVTVAFSGKVGGKAVGQVSVSWFQVHMAEQVMFHVMAVGVWIRREEADVFVEIKSAAE
jgi:hypothetical protein